MISQAYSLIPACDTSPDNFRKLIAATAELEGVGAYKLGFRLALEIGLKEAVRIIRDHSKKPIIYDHQKAATDIPATGKLFAEVCKDSGVDAVILFPLTGPEVLSAWVEACLEVDLGTIVGGLMTHHGFLQSEKGFISDDATHRIYVQAAELGVTDFVVPATRVDFSWQVFANLEQRGIKPTFYSPGIGAQGGSWQELMREDGPHWHAIVGRSLYGAKDMRAAAQELLASR